MTAMLQDQDYSGLEPVEALKLQLEAKKNNAFQKQKTDEVSFSESS